MNSTKGFTLLELLVGLVIMTIVFFASIGFFIKNTEVSGGFSNQTKAGSDLDDLISQIGSDIRNRVRSTSVMALASGSPAFTGLAACSPGATSDCPGLAIGVPNGATIEYTTKCTAAKVSNLVWANVAGKPAGFLCPDNQVPQILRTVMSPTLTPSPTPIPPISALALSVYFTVRPACDTACQSVGSGCPNSCLVDGEVEVHAQALYRAQGKYQLVSRDASLTFSDRPDSITYQ